MQAMILLLCVLLANAGFYSKKSGVRELDIDNFDDIVNTKAVCVVEFYAPWCGHCKQLKPEYIKAAKELGDSIPVYAVDLAEEKNKELAMRFGIQGFPTIHIFHDYGKYDPYKGARNAEGITQAARMKLPNIVKQISSKKKKDMKAWKKSKKTRAVLVHKKSKTPDFWKSLAVTFTDHIEFYENRKDKKFHKLYGLKKDDLKTVLLFPGDDDPAKYDGKLKVKSLKRWLRKFAPDFPEDPEDSLPAMTDESCFQKFCVAKGICVVVLLGTDADDARRVSEVVLELRENSERASLFGFGTISVEHNYEWVEKLFPGSAGDYSQLIVFSPKKKMYAQYVGSFSYDTVASFVHGILTGRTRTSKMQIKEIPQLSTKTENCPRPKEQPKPKKPEPKVEEEDDDDWGEDIGEHEEL